MTDEMNEGMEKRFYVFREISMIRLSPMIGGWNPCHALSYTRLNDMSSKPPLVYLIAARVNRARNCNAYAQRTFLFTFCPKTSIFAAARMLFIYSFINKSLGTDQTRI